MSIQKTKYSLFPFNRSSFTLMEICIVGIVLAAIAGLAYNNYNKVLKSQECNNVQRNLTLIYNQLLVKPKQLNWTPSLGVLPSAISYYTSIAGACPGYIYSVGIILNNNFQCDLKVYDVNPGPNQCKTVPLTASNPHCYPQGGSPDYCTSLLQ